MYARHWSWKAGRQPVTDMENQDTPTRLPGRKKRTQAVQHLVADLAPEGEGLQHVMVLPLVAVREPRPAHAPADRQARSRLSRIRPAPDYVIV